MTRRAALLSALVTVGCGGASGATVKSVPVPSGGKGYVIECERSPDLCDRAAKETCPRGYRTLEPGRGNWYAEGEDFMSPPSSPKPRPLYRRAGWVIACDE
jgi:hypothetical protein